MICESPAKKYQKYSREKRIQLIKMVDQQKLSTAHAARILGIKQTSACRIMKSYHLNNKIFERKADRLNREEGKCKSDSSNFVFSGINSREENGVNKNQNTNSCNMNAQRTPFASLNINKPQNMDRDVRNNEEFANSACHIAELIPLANSPYFPVYYPAMYPLMFSCFM